MGQTEEMEMKMDTQIDKWTEVGRRTERGRQKHRLITRCVLKAQRVRDRQRPEPDAEPKNSH